MNGVLELSRLFRTSFVFLPTLNVTIVLTSIYQMEEYRERDARSNTISSMSVQAEAVPSTITLDAWQEFISEYEASLGDGQATFSRIPAQRSQSIQEEYSTYVMGALSAGSTSDTLGFWRVGPHTINHICG